MKNKPSLSIIGLGKVGTTLAIAAKHSQQYNLIIGSRDKTKEENAKKWLGDETQMADINTAASMGDIVMLTVGDDVIKTVCDQLVDAKAFKRSAIITHCSGALSSDILSKAKDACGTHLASMHPLQTFPDIESALEKLSTTDCYYEGDTESKKPIQHLINSLGMEAREIKKQSKILYHASAVVACNYFSALIDASLELGEVAGIDRDTLWSSLKPLVSATLDNISQKGPANALTGPIARGDTNTVEQHLHALNTITSHEAAQRLTRLYSSVGVQTIALAKKKGSLSTHTENTLLKKLKQD